MRSRSQRDTKAQVAREGADTGTSAVPIVVPLADRAVGVDDGTRVEANAAANASRARRSHPGCSLAMPDRMLQPTLRGSLAQALRDWQGLSCLAHARWASGSQSGSRAGLAPRIPRRCRRDPHAHRAHRDRSCTPRSALRWQREPLLVSIAASAVDRKRPATSPTHERYNRSRSNGAPVVVRLPATS
jgi:hypothetical protein